MLIRTATVDDFAAIATLHERDNGHPTDPNALRASLRDYPAAVAEHNDTLVGFVFCGRFAPDILEVRNLLVATQHRSTGLGARLLQHIETRASTGWNAVILSNSDAYQTPGKRPATAFYLRNGYTNVWSTPTTRVFRKTLTDG